MLASNLLKGYRIKTSLPSSNHDAVQHSMKVIFKEFAPSIKAAPFSPKEEVVQQSFKNIFKQLSRSSRFALQFTNMSTCPKCSIRLIRPPSLSSLRIRFPALIVDTTLDRSQLRCQHCDEMLAGRLGIEAELPPPNYSNPITKLEKTIKKLKDLVEEDIEEEEDVRTLKSMIHGMQLKLGNMVRKRDADIKQAWMPYWAIWGVTKGQEAYSLV
jgi:hypothetical protein